MALQSRRVFLFAIDKIRVILRGRDPPIFWVFQTKEIQKSEDYQMNEKKEFYLIIKGEKVMVSEEEDRAYNRPLRAERLQ